MNKARHSALGVNRCRPLLAVALAALVAGVQAGDPPAQNAIYSPPVRDRVTSLYWGDTHLHTSLSADAHTMETRLDKEQALRFARGEKVVADNGMEVKLRRPLDFLAVTDHAEYLGIYARLLAGDPALEGWEVGERWAGYMKSGQLAALGKEFSDAIQSSDGKYQVPEGVAETIWQDAAATADRFNEPHLFTAFIGYEWTSMITGDNLHRVVLFRDDARKAGSVLPFTAQHSTDPEDLWAALTDYEAKAGGQVLAIAHNGNVSNGRMFAPLRINGQPLDSDYATRRARWEPVYEVTQVKGDGETHPYLSPDDEFADFETWDEGNITLTAPKEDAMLAHEYARSALRQGLQYQVSLGANPYKFGMIGSTDSHTGLATADEDNFFGKFVESEPSDERVANKMAAQLQESWQLGASGLAAVWADENTRESLFDAIRRREVYATSGPRIQVRFFGGWEFDEKDLRHPDFATVGYRKGVPMGGDLAASDSQGAPTFMIVAARDPDGANLDRVQVIKGWLDANGETHEKVHDVALSDGRRVDPKTGKAPAVGSTVDVADASYTNSIGASELAVVWRDPDFDPAQHAFYYVRVLEIPTPRWTAHDAKFFKLDMPDHVPMVVQDRAYTSPIWYSP